MQYMQERMPCTLMPIPIPKTNSLPVHHNTCREEVDSSLMVLCCQERAHHETGTLCEPPPVCRWQWYGLMQVFEGLSYTYEIT